MGITIVTIKATAADASGDSSDTTPNPVNGIIRAIEVVYGAGSDAGMDLYLTEEGKTTDQAIMTLASTATSQWVYPYNYAEDTTGTDLTYDATRKIPVPFYVARPLTLVQDDQTAAKTVTVYIYVEK